MIQPVVNALSVEFLTEGTIVDVPMEEYATKIQNELAPDRIDRTHFAIIIPGIEPVVDCIMTVEGKVDGPLMRFLGSVATRDPDNIVTGYVVPGFRLVMSTVEESNARFIMPGTVHNLQPAVTMNRRYSLNRHKK